uniref:aspartate/glutamate racemase family protein n=1 Tax=Variovorax sp. BK018 TaxID=3450241 RepID=UPI00104A5769
MRTLFLNPNSSDEITATLRRHIARCGWHADEWEVAKVEGAPRIIGTALENAQAVEALDRRLCSLRAGFDRVVVMSSLDTGYDIVRGQLGDAAFGFTRSVLAQHRSLGRKLQVITFDMSMTALYERAFDATGHGSVVGNWRVLDAMPAAVAARPDDALAELRRRCRELEPASQDKIFVVGAVGLELAAALRAEGLHSVIDPVADLLAWLRAAESSASG